MQKNWYKPLIPHLIALGIFLVVAVVYCKPAFEHKALSQYDNDQWKAMAHNSYQYKEVHGHFPLWTEGMFSGMPAYQIAMDAPSLSPQYLVYEILTLGLPKPANFFFLGCICFYILMLAFRINPYAGIACALAYAYTTYNLTALVVGHETKIQAIQVMPAFLAGLVLLFEKQYWTGAAALALFTALFIAANHPQINYYGGMIAVFMSAGYAIRYFRAKDFRHLVLVATLAIGAFGLGIACNAVVTLTTFDYSKASLRSGSVLATPGGSVTTTGLSPDYALSYSMYKTEAFELLVPKIFGGGGRTIDAMISQDDSKAIAELQNIPPQLQNLFQRFTEFYWGGIGESTGGPAYAGAVICFLGLLGFFLLDGKHKWWILSVSVLALLMSWGSNFIGFNSFLLRVLPGYNKFRAPSVAIVIPNLLLCVLAGMTLDRIFKMKPADRDKVLQQYKKGLWLTAAIFGILLICYLSFDYVGIGDKQLLQIASSQQQQQFQDLVHTFLRELRADRQSIFFGSLTRSFLYILVAAAIGFFWIKGRIKPMLALGLLGALAFIDIITLDTLYMNADSFRDEEESQTPFTATRADQQIMRDTSYYRVFDLREGAGKMITNLATAAYFHRTIAGYHPAKLSIYEDLLENQLEKHPNCQPVLNMLNTKYLLLPTADGRGDSAALNPDALGPVWFVRNAQSESTPRAVMADLYNFNPANSAVVFSKDSAAASGFSAPVASDTIFLVHNDNDKMIYHSTASGRRFAVFSEVYYDRGWLAYIDDAEAPIIRTNYVLRGLVVPPGQHTIRFTFHPRSYYTGWTIQVIASILLLVLLAAAVIKEWRRRP